MNEQIPHALSIEDAAGALRSGSLSAVELARAYLDRIDARNDRLGAYVTVTREAALAQAERADRALAAGEDRGALHGIPVAIKDIIDARGVRTTAGSRVLADNVAESDSTLTERLERAGAVLLGKLNLSEFAIGGTIDHPYGTPRNPWNTEHSAGGSSSGSGVAVAAGLCAGALGSDTGGSIRGPAAFCGIVGIRPTYGRVTRHGVAPMCWSMDTVGPMTRTVRDCAIMLAAIAGRDERDTTSSRNPVPDYLASMEDGTNGLRVGLPNEMFEYEALSAETHEAVMRAVTVLEELGASSERMSLPTTEHSGAVFVASADVDAASFHEPWLKSRPQDYDWSTRIRLESALLTPSTAYIRAQRARARIRHELLEALERYDVLVMPTGPVTAPSLAASTGKPGGYYQGRSDLGRRRYTSPAALAGLPALSLPCGFSSAGLPIGMQIIGRPFDEAGVFRAARAYERATEWRTIAPDDSP
jgi:aspartyl-tRNA(Asn)/glutamyl-tRNA(Gln) amidotransferase subunit A